MKFTRVQKNIFIIACFTLFSLHVSLPSRIGSIDIPKLNTSIPSIDRLKNLEIKLGLDIKGGVQVTLDTDMSKISPEDKQSAQESLKDVVSKRIDLFGVSEPSIKTLQSNDQFRLQVELPGVTDTVQAVNLIGETAQLEFAYPIFAEPENATDEPDFLGFSPAGLTGSDLKKAEVTFNTQDNLPAVAIQFNKEGGERFGEITKNNIGKSLSILLDGYEISRATIQTEIPNGSGVISGRFNLEEAKELALKLNAGALPVPVKVISQKNIPATLGQESIYKSLIAGVIGLVMVIIFMIGNYGKMGIISSVGLILYGLYTITIYKLIGVVLTLPGIAGFILSVGMAVDSNILIFERFKEEINAGRPPQVALELAFGRAWDSIKDANTATIITGLILFNPLNWTFLNTSGSVKGFALTLILGIIISLFTGIFVTRNLLRTFYKNKL